MKNPFKNKLFRRWFWIILIALVLLLRIPTRLSVATVNWNSDYPIDLLEKEPDLSDFR